MNVYGNHHQHPEYKELLVRHPRNPILCPKDWPYPVNSVFNPGAVKLTYSGEVLLLVRVEDRRGISHLCAARSTDGVQNWRIDEQPTLTPARDQRREDLWGMEDARITWIPELDRYAIAYTSFSHGGPGVSLALTKNFKQFEQLGMILPPEDKDAALFPHRIKGRWAILHRPISAVGDGSAHIWLSCSPDLRYWGDHHILLRARQGAWWDARKIGLSPPPIETKAGWLIFYHGVRKTASGCLYRVGLALLDLENPCDVIYRSSEWIFSPQESYERVGDVSEVVFPTGAVLGADGDSLQIYYGAADSSVALATASVRELLDWLKEHHYAGVE